jgi:methylphosphotriester-DNA--protein-cysteine methyltransferase
MLTQCRDAKIYHLKEESTELPAWPAGQRRPTNDGPERAYGVHHTRECRPGRNISSRPEAIAVNERLFLRLDDDTVQGPQATLPAGTLRAFAPGPALQRHVSHILQYRETVPAGCEIHERVLPDGAVRLIFNLGEAPSVAGHAGRPAEVAGASAAPVVVRLRDRVDGLSVTLRPGAVVALLGLPAGEIAGAAVPLDELWRGEGVELLERMARQPDDAGRVAALRAVLQRRLRRADAATTTPPAAAQAALRAAQLIAAAGGRRPLREVAAAVGVGERRLQQIFHAHVGLSPRTWSRLARLHGCLRALRLQRMPAWADVAADGGFYDQSHLVNEFRALCGLTPTEFLGQAVSVSSKTPA